MKYLKYIQNDFILKKIKQYIGDIVNQKNYDLLN
jgi:hypothetical protein